MKKITLVFILIFSFAALASKENTAARRSNALLKFIAEHEGLRNFGLGTVINNRCNRYMPYGEKADCRLAVKRMISLLDFDVIITEEKDQRPNWRPSSFVFVAFKQNLISLLNTPKTAVYLDDLNQQLYKYLLHEIPHLNIWDITKAHYKTDYMTSLVLATLFQDTSLMKLHIGYLQVSRVRGNQNFQSNMDLLSRVIDTINLILDSSEDEYRKLFYPEEIQKHLNRNIYHFYVPLFLSKSLQAYGTPTKYAYTAALMLTLSYEFVTSSNDYRYLYADPANITYLGSIKDIFGGYCGSNFGVRGMNFNKSFEPIRATFERNTEDAVMMLLRH